MMNIISRYFVIISISILGLIGFSYAQDVDVMNLPIMNTPVVDYSNTLTTAQRDQLNTIAVGLQSGNQGAQVTTVIIADRQGYELFDIGMKIATDNQIGQQGLDNGLLLVIAKDEKKLRIMVGYGLEGVIPDIVARQIIENNLRPYVNQGDIYGAVQERYGVVPQYLIPGSQPDTLQQSSWFETLGMFALFIAFGLVGWGGYLGSKLGDYLNGEETSDQLAKLKTKSGFNTYSWILGVLMFIVGAALGFVAFVLISWIIGFVVGALGSYTRVISPNFRQTIRQELYRDRDPFSGWSSGGFGGGFGGGGRSGGGGSFGGGGAGD